MMLRLLIILAIMLAAGPAAAHKPSDSYVRLQVKGDEISGDWAVALRDLDVAVGIDSNFDGKITWGELLAARPAIERKLDSALVLENGGKLCPLAFRMPRIDLYSDGHYALFPVTAHCTAAIESLTVGYQLLFDLDAQHKGLLSLTAGDYSQSAIFSTDLRKVTLSLHAPSSWRQFQEYARQGMWHIWLGFDHFLFLIALLLPAAWIFRNGVRRTDMPFKTVFWEVFGYISAFTLAHALTLGLALFDLIHVRSRIVESLIALTIVVSCLNNIWPFFKQRLWMLTFSFGLIHGMGFATTLSELGLVHAARWIALAGFNVGVELGQLVIVVILLPIFYSIRQHAAYRVVIVQGGSWLIFLVSAIWFIQRAFDVTILRFLRY